MNRKDLIDVIAARRSIRAFRPEPVPEGLVLELLRAAMAAPSACNEQPWRFIVVTDPELLTGLAKRHPYGRPVGKAPLCIVPCCDLDLVVTLYAGDFWVQDMSAATQNLLLAATALSLGGVWIGTYPDMARVTGVQEVLELPERIVPLCLVPIGFPAEEKPPHSAFDPDRVVRDSW